MDGGSKISPTEGGGHRAGDAPNGWPLEPDGPEMRRLVHVAMERVVRHVETLPTQPSADLDGAAQLAESLIEPVPERGTDIAPLLDLLFDRAVPTSFNTAGPGYLAYIPGGGLFHSALADLIADVVNRYTGVWIAAPGLVQLESNVIRWFADFVSYPQGARGILTSGGSLANFSALVTARHERLPRGSEKGTFYVSDQVHHSMQKAAMLAGVPDPQVRTVPSDDAFRMRRDALEQMIEADRANGLSPFLVVGSAGTVNTGAVDDLPALADLARRQGLWFHVDGAYGGFFVMTERGRGKLKGMELADSITLDPHKGLFLPYGTGCLLVKDGAALRRAHSIHGEYLPTMQEDSQFVDFCQYSPELSRDFRGLRVWLPFKLVGVQAFRDALDEKLDLARWATDRLREIDGIEIVAEPELSIVAFQVRRRGLSQEEANRLSRELMERVNARKRVYLTATTVRGRFLVRICVLSFRTHLDRMQAGIEDVQAALRELS